MAPRDTPKVERIIKTAKAKASPVSTIKKKAISAKNTTERILKVNNTNLQTRSRTSTVPKTPKSGEQKLSVPLPGSVTKSAKKAAWKRRPKPAHSGVPLPEKMKKLFDKQLQQADCSP